MDYIDMKSLLNSMNYDTVACTSKVIESIPAKKKGFGRNCTVYFARHKYRWLKFYVCNSTMNNTALYTFNSLNTLNYSQHYYYQSLLSIPYSLVIII